MVDAEILVVLQEGALMTELEKRLRQKYVESSPQILSTISEINFSPKGMEEIHKLLTEAMNNHKPGYDIAVNLERHENTWLSQPDEIRGDIQASGNDGEDSIIALYDMYHNLRLPIPEYLRV